MNNAQASTALTWLLAAVSLFFIGLGARDEADVFLLLGCLSTALADAAFAAHLVSQRAGGANATLTTAYACGAVAALYIATHQAARLRARGCGENDDDDDDDEADGGGGGGGGGGGNDAMSGSGADADAVRETGSGDGEAGELARLRAGLRKVAASAHADAQPPPQEPPQASGGGGGVRRLNR